MINDQNKYHKLSNEDSECDLGVLFKSNLKFDELIDNTINKVNPVIGLIKRKFMFIDKDLFLTLYKSLIRSHLDYGNLICYITTKNISKCWKMLSVELQISARIERTVIQRATS